MNETAEAIGTLSSMPDHGVTAAYGDNADFGEITEAAPLQIGAVAHKAYVDVDEHGTEAAAATAVVIRAAAAMRPPPAVRPELTSAA